MTGTAPVDHEPPRTGVPGPALGEGFDSPQPFLRLWTAPARLGARALAPEQPSTVTPTPRTGDLRRAERATRTPTGRPRPCW